MAKPQPPDVQASSAQQGLAPASGSPEQQQGDAAARCFKNDTSPADVSPRPAPQRQGLLVHDQGQWH
eukprot:scaffold129494_cov13-Tisochrysis_lutea.AAC.1